MRGGGVHVDEVAVGVSVEVVAARFTELADGAGTGRAEPDVRHGAIVGKSVLGVVEMDVGAAGVAVQVALQFRKVLAAGAGGEMVGPAVVCLAVGHGAALGVDGEVGDIAVVDVVGVDLEPAEQVDEAQEKSYC